MSSSDQQLNVPNDSCQSKQNHDNQQCDLEKCSDNVISVNIMLDSEIATSNESNRNESDGNAHNGSKKLAVMEENDQVVVSNVNENESNVQAVAKSDHGIKTGDLSEHNDREVVIDNLQIRNGYSNSTALNGDRVPVSADQPNAVDLQIPNETVPQTITLDQPNDRDNHENSDVNSEIEHNEDASDDENENFFNKHDSNEDSSEFPDIVDFDGTNEVENEEYILDTVVRKPRKERRRIVSVNDDDSDPEMEVERELLLQSPTVDKNELADSRSEEEEDDIEQLIQNEKPGPKSKKISTQKLKELQARELLRNAVVIPSSSKKKKNRIIDSDDDEENASLLPYCVDVDDIGLLDTMDDHDNENDSDALGSSILLNDINKPDSSSTENLNQNDSPGESNIDEIAVKLEPKDVQPSLSSSSPNTKCSIASLQEEQKQPLEIKPVLVKEEGFDDTKDEAVACDSLDRANKQCKKENENDTFVNTDFPPFPSSSSSDDDDEFIPNEVYFGTPDHNKKKKYETLLLQPLTNAK